MLQLVRSSFSMTIFCGFFRLDLIHTIAFSISASASTIWAPLLCAFACCDCICCWNRLGALQSWYRNVLRLLGRFSSWWPAEPRVFWKYALRLAGTVPEDVFPPYIIQKCGWADISCISLPHISHSRHGYCFQIRTSKHHLWNTCRLRSP